VFEKAVADGLIAVGTVVPKSDVGKTVEGEAYDESGEIPMKGKKCSQNDLKFNRIAPKKNQA